MSGLPPADSSVLLERCRQGDQAAFRQLFALYSPTVLRLVGRMLGRREDIEDTVQEVFLQVHRSLKDFRGDSKFSTWLHRVTVNVVLMARRAAQSRPSFAPAPPDEMLSDDRPWPDEDAARHQRLLAFQRCIDKLSEKKRTVFLLHELEGLPAAEIAEIVGAPILTVRTRLFYARQELADLMRQEPTLVALADLDETSETKTPPRDKLKSPPSNDPGQTKP